MKLDAEALVSLPSFRSRLRFLLKDTTLYGGAMAVSRFFSFFTVPILARLLSRSEFGVVDALAVLSAVFVPLMVMGQDTAVARYFYDTADERERKEILSQSLMFEFLCVLFCTPLLWLFSRPLMRFFLSGSDYLTEFRIVILSLPFQVLLGFGQNILKWTFQRVRFLVISIGNVVTTVALTILLVVVFRMGVRGVFFAQLITRIVFAALSLWYCRKRFVWPSHYRYVLPMLQFGWPYMFLGVSICFMPMIERYFIVSRLGLEVLGLYAAAAKLAGLMHFPIGGFQTAWGPFAYALCKDSRAQQTYNLVLLAYVIAMGILGFAVVALARPMLLALLSSKFLDSQAIVLPIVFALIIDSISWITGIGIDLSKKTYASAGSYLAGVIATFLAMPLSIRWLGLLGAAYAILFGRTVLTMTKTLWAYRVYPGRFDLGRPTAFLALALGLAWWADRYMASLAVGQQILGCGVLLSVLIGVAIAFLARSRKVLSVAGETACS